MKPIIDSKKINELLTRGVDKIYPSPKVLEKVLKSGKRIRLYNGIDPSGAKLHIGHTAQLRKLRLFQELGHEVILLIGSFTAMIGDPTGKNQTRVPLTREQVLENAKNYKEQASKILDFNGENPVKIKYNHEWLDDMSLRDFADLGQHITVPQLLERDMFEKRLQAGETISVAEFIYPMLQGYDSVAMDVDLEIGGSDQTFNMLVGRDFMKSFANKEKFVMTLPLLVDSKGMKIGKSEGNVIGITDSPEELFGKIMALGDDVIISIFESCTDVSMEEISKIKSAIKKGENPRNLKARLAETIVRMYHSESEAKKAVENFDNVFKKHEAPEKIKTFKVKNDKWNIVDLLVETKLASSKSEARRLIEQGGIKFGGQTLGVGDQEIIIPKKGDILQRGKRQFIKIVL